MARTPQRNRRSTDKTRARSPRKQLATKAQRAEPPQLRLTAPDEYAKSSSSSSNNSKASLGAGAAAVATPAAACSSSCSSSSSSSSCLDGECVLKLSSIKGTWSCDICGKRHASGAPGYHCEHEYGVCPDCAKLNCHILRHGPESLSPEQREQLISVALSPSGYPTITDKERCELNSMRARKEDDSMPYHVKPIVTCLVYTPKVRQRDIRNHETLQIHYPSMCRRRRICVLLTVL
jgi:hypothetical protein